MKRICLAAVLAMMFLLAGCREPTAAGIKSRLEKRMAELNSYHALSELRIKTDKTIKKYEAEQWYLDTGFCRVDVRLPEGTLQKFISDGNFIYIYEEELDEWFKADLDQEPYPIPPFMLPGYLQNILAAGRVEYLGKEKYDQGSYYKLEIEPCDASPMRKTEIFWLDTKTMLPVRIDTYGEDGELTAEHSFKEINLNIKLDEEIFQTNFE
ncbi:MAG TPA: outer membrane lipoprotein carrier protein LolA [Firmicutes bacterium]|nr:outer membrane lipoprotein carrier protein LolA [Bacillota bacterium]